MTLRNGATHRIQIAVSVFFTGLSVALILLGYHFGAFRWVDGYLFDLHFKWRGSIPPSGDVVLVLMDKESADALGREKASWSRRQMAVALDHLCRAGAEIIGMDMIFMAPDPLPSVDRELAEAMDRCNNVVLARGTGTYGGELASIPIFQEVMIGDGFIDFLLDEDEILRRVRYLNAKPLPDGGLELFPAFSLELARTFLNLDFTFDFSREDFLGIGREGSSQLLIPYPELIINYHGNHRVFPTLSYLDVVENDFPPESVRGKLVIIGSSLATEKDIFSTPFTRFMKPTDTFADVFGSVVREVLSAKDLGVACHAHAVETMLSGEYIRKLSASWARTWIVLLGIIGAVFYLPRFGIMGAAGFLLLGMGFVIGAGHLAFLENRLWMPVAPLLAVLGIQYLGGVIVQKIFEQRRASFVTSLFGRYVSYGVVRELIRGNLDVDMEGRHQDLTILFSDIRDFTNLSERLGARGTGLLLNHYFSNMVPIVFRHQGTLDKLMGDAIMAFFGAPVEMADHPVKAAEAAVHMLNRLRKMREDAAVEGMADLMLGIGINTGVVTVGNLGSNDFMDYTVIGDPVNLASRAEGLNKVYGTEIIVSEFTAARLDDRFLLRELDRVRVKGKEEAVTLFELMGYRAELPPETVTMIEYFESGLDLYRKREWESAAERFGKVLAIQPADGPSRLYLERLEACCSISMDEEWDSVTAFKSK